MQVEALHRYRGKGQQKVTVEHVHVNAGGQAIVGTVHPPDVKKKWNEPDAPREITQGQDTPLRSPGPGAGTRADRQRCAANAAVGCMAAQPEAVLLWAIRTPSGMGIIQQKSLLRGEN